jgi:hypothetical protein
MNGPDERPLSVLLLCNYEPHQAATVCDHIDAFARYSRHRVFTCSRVRRLPAALDLDRFDAIVIHYSIFIAVDAYMAPDLRDRLARFAGLKAVFIQDEYRFVNRTIAALRQIGAHLVFTCVPEPEIEKVYPAAQLPGVRFVNVLTGCVPEALLDRPAPALEARPVEIGYRGRRYPAWHGQLGLDRQRIGERVLQDAPRYGLRCDISSREEDRMYGSRWIDFLLRCKAVLGTESGSSVFDFDETIANGVDAHLDRDPHASYDELRAGHFAAEEGRIRLNQISPRCFEAAALRTLLVLYEGRYSDILVPWRHYVPLRHDHGNMDDVVATLRDPAASQAIVDRAYDEIARNPRYGYRAYIEQIDQAIGERFAPAPQLADPGGLSVARAVAVPHLRSAARASCSAYEPDDFVRLCGRPGETQRVARLLSRAGQAVHGAVDGYLLPLLPPRLRPAARQRLRRAAERLRRAKTYVSDARHALRTVHGRPHAAERDRVTR